METLNYGLFSYINRFAGVNPVLDKVGVASASYMPLVFVLWAAYLWFTGTERERNIVLIVAYAAITGLLINYAITKMYFHPRPFMLHMGRLLIPHSQETSFPSDHATFMLSVALAASCFRRTRAAAGVLFVLGLVGGLSRVFCGLHFPLDIAGSLGVALVSSATICVLGHMLGKVNRRVLEMYDTMLRRLGSG